MTLFEWWIEPFTQSEAMRTALGAGLLAVLTTSIVGTWVVLRGMTFLGDALAHGVLPGLAGAFVIGIDPRIGAVIAALVMVGALNLVRKYSPLPDDATIGVLFVGFLAAAVVIMSSNSSRYVGDLNRFMFGSITGITTADLARQAVVAVGVVVVTVVLYRALLVATFDETLAQMLGLHPRGTHTVLLLLLALAIVASFQAVGSLLVFAFLVAPPAAAAQVVRRVPWIMATAVAIGAVSAVLGLLISFHRGTAAGATMALVAVTIFGCSVGVRAVQTTVRT